MLIVLAGPLSIAMPKLIIDYFKAFKSTFHSFLSKVLLTNQKLFETILIPCIFFPFDFDILINWRILEKFSSILIAVFFLLGYAIFELPFIAPFILTIQVLYDIVECLVFLNHLVSFDGANA